ncbi:hypothetical protein JTB14_034920 [Gonioctena quinquepunctata]|nr:hypothetical protein JTB14_034920 [Gonioctena quinquepunctata]
MENKLMDQIIMINVEETINDFKECNKCTSFWYLVESIQKESKFRLLDKVVSFLINSYGNIVIKDLNGDNDMKGSEQHLLQAI